METVSGITQGKAYIKSTKKLLSKSKFRFVLKGINGETIAVGEAYTQKHNVTEVLEKYFPTFKIIDETKK